MSEVGVLIDERTPIENLVTLFDHVFEKAGVVESEQLEDLDASQRRARKRKVRHGRKYGNHVKLRGKRQALKPRISVIGEAPGWILIHSEKKFGQPEYQYDNPEDELDKEFSRKGLMWHWKWKNALREGGPYRILFAWEGKVFGEGLAKITHNIERSMYPEYNFAFFVSKYRKRKKVSLADLPLGNREIHHHSLIKLDRAILAAYDRLKSVRD
jgi:hypothetical protein